MSMLLDNEPGQDDEPPILRGDAPPGMFTPRWEELQETYGIDRPRGLTRSVISFTGCLRTMGSCICRRGTEWWPLLTYGRMN